MTADHPPDDALRAFLDGKLLVAEAGPIETHLGGCDACVARLESLAAGGDTFGQRVRDAALTATVDQAERPGTNPSVADGSDRLIGTVVAGRYKLRQAIGEGGMGSVYLADQTQPVRRHVALKLIKPGMDSRQVLARFESERQALALMDHPHIARVLDAGTTEQGRPFFVMELVKGVPLTEYCDAHQLDLPTRLKLFRQICSAVQHAHQKGIIHRDLKPTNILVENHDEEPVPKVIDFGLAKATSGLSLTDQSLFTAFGSVAGTPLYMAPEQAAFNALDVDTRADIYALGVILYELLTGSTPIRRESLHRVAVDEMLRVIREEEPPTPSSRISTSEGLPSIAAVRRVEPGRLSRLVRGDLDWIVMKALAKERGRRYDSAIGLANDVERFLADEPVSAGPPTARYRAAKFIRRHRGRVVAASLVVLALVVGVVGTTLGLIEARAQRAEAERLAEVARAEVAEKERARQAESEQRGRAERRLAQNEKAIKVLGSVFADLDPGKVEREGKPLAALLGERLDQATAAIEGDSIGDPLAVADMQMTLGSSQLGLGYPEKAAGLFARAHATLAARFEPDHPEVLRSLSGLATAYRVAGRLGEAIPLYERVLALRRAKLGPDHLDTLGTMYNLAESYKVDQRPDQAISLQEEVLRLVRAKLGPDDPYAVQSLAALANAFGEVGRFDRSLPLFEEAVAKSAAKLGADHPATIAAMNNLATTYFAAGQVARAIPLAERTLVLIEAKLGPDHPQATTCAANLGEYHQRAGQLDRAIPLFERSVRQRRLKPGPDHALTILSMVALANAYQATGQVERAIPLFEEALDRSRANQGPDHLKTLSYMDMLAEAYRVSGQPERSLPLLKEVVRVTKRQSGTESRNYAGALASLGLALLDSGQWEEAEAVVGECLALRERIAGDDWLTFNTRSMLGAALLGRERYGEAAPLLIAGYEGLKQRAGKIPPAGKPRVVEALDRLIRLAEATGRPEDATRWREEKAGWVSPPADGVKK